MGVLQLIITFVVGVRTVFAAYNAQSLTTNAVVDLAATVAAIETSVWDCHVELNELTAPPASCRKMHDALEMNVGRMLHSPTQTCSALIPIMSLPYMDMVNLFNLQLVLTAM